MKVRRIETKESFSFSKPLLIFDKHLASLDVEQPEINRVCYADINDTFHYKRYVSFYQFSDCSNFYVFVLISFILLINDVVD